MKKEEKTKQTCEKIVHAATIEFGSRSYDAVSLNAICGKYQIAKGLIYHNFKNKDELYLKCVETCFEAITDYFENQDNRVGSVQERMKRLFQIRQQFFQENPYYCNLFFNTVFQPPKHLRSEIQELRKKYDEFYVTRFRELLQQLKLRDGITVDAAMEYFLAFLEMFNGYFQSKSGENGDLHALIEDHEVNLSKILDIMLYGVAKEGL